MLLAGGHEPETECAHPESALRGDEEGTQSIQGHRP